MSDLVEFLRARLDEDEAAAKLVSQPYRLYVSTDGRLSEPLRIDDLHGERDGEYQQWPEGGDRMPNDIANWSLVYDPARVLREVEAKRRIVDEHADDGGYCRRCTVEDRQENTLEEIRNDGPYMITVHRPLQYPCPTLRLLTLPYTDHEDFKDEWRP